MEKYSENGIIDNYKIKSSARNMLSKDLWFLLKPVLVVILVGGLVALIERYCFTEDYNINLILSTSISLLTAPLSVGLLKYYLSYVRGRDYSLKDLFRYYGTKVIYIWGVSLLSTLIVSLYFCLLIIPGLIALISYSMVNYIIAEDEEIKVYEVLNKSRTMMRGYKLDYFLFNFSFIGWYILGIFTFGLAYLYVIPYVQLSNTLYYEELKRIKK